MATTTTTAGGAIGASDVTIKVAATTDFGRNKLIKVDDEFMQQSAEAVGLIVPVIRGVNGTVAKAHPVTSNVTVGSGSDFTGDAVTVIPSYPLSGRQRRVVGYTTSLVTLTNPSPGTDGVAVLNGTSVLVMTLSSPTKDQDGDRFVIIGNGEAAHTVTYSGGFGGSGSGYTVATFTTGGQNAIEVMACNGVWVLLSPMTGTLTTAVPAIS